MIMLAFHCSRRWIHPVLTVVALVVGFHAAPATSAPAAAADRVTVELGAYHFTPSTSTHIVGPFGIGTAFKLENLGASASSRTVPRIEFFVRPFERHRLRFKYVEADRDRTADIVRVSAAIGTSVNAGLHVRRFEADYLYSFWKSDAAEAAVALGLHYTRLEGFVQFPALHIVGRATSEDPLPMVGLLASRRVRPDWEVLAHVFGMPARVGRVNGRAFGYRIATRYYLTRNLGLGVGWSRMRYDMEPSGRLWRGTLDASDRGGEVFVSLRY
jgi:hypothetical protein